MSYATYMKAFSVMLDKQSALETAMIGVNAHPQSKVASLDGNASANLNYLQQLKKESSGMDTYYNKVCSDLAAAKNAKTKDTKKINELEKLKTTLDKQRSDKRAQIAQQDLKYQNAKKEFENEKREYTAAQQKQTRAKSEYDTAVKNMEREKPWYLKLGDKVIGKTDATIIVGSKVYNAVDWEGMEKAAVAAGKAVGAMKDPPETIVKALNTIGNYLGYINKINTAVDTAGSVNDAISSIKALIEAGKKYSKASSDSEKVNAVEAIATCSFYTLEKAFNIKGGIISSVASVANQFCTALIKAIAAVTRLGQNRGFMQELNWELGSGQGQNLDSDGIYAAAQSVSGGYEIAVKMIQDNKTSAQILEALDAYKTLKKAS